MSTEVIAMLTHNDETSKDSFEIFENCKDLPVKYWGFKDVGLSIEELKELNKTIKENGNTTVLEVVSFGEKDGLEAAKLAYECGIDYLTGTVYYPSVLEYAKEKNIKYFPFSGDVSATPQIELKGQIEDVIEDSKQLIEKGVSGVDLVAYRSLDADPLLLAKSVINEVGRENIIIAGSINSVEKIKLMNEVGPFAYTIGGALFEAKFVEGGSFRDNLEYVIQLNEKLQ
jgi:hypothetical protein